MISEWLQVFRMDDIFTFWLAISEIIRVKTSTVSPWSFVWFLLLMLKIQYLMTVYKHSRTQHFCGSLNCSWLLYSFGWNLGLFINQIWKGHHYRKIFQMVTDMLEIVPVLKSSEFLWYHGWIANRRINPIHTFSGYCWVCWTTPRLKDRIIILECHRAQNLTSRIFIGAYFNWCVGEVFVTPYCLCLLRG